MARRRPTEVVQVNLRLREDVRQQLWRAAKKSGRSFNQEVVHRIEESFTRVPIDKALVAVQAIANFASYRLIKDAKARGKTVAESARVGPIMVTDDFLEAWSRDIEEGEEGDK